MVEMHGVLPEGAGGGVGSSPRGRWWKTWHLSRNASGFSLSLRERLWHGAKAVNAAPEIRRIARDGAVRQGQGAETVNAAPKNRRIARDGAVGEGQGAVVVDAAPRIARDGAVAKGQRAGVADAAAESAGRAAAHPGAR